MSDYEDASPDAMKAYASIGLTESLEDIRKNDALLQKWTAYKTTTIDDFAQDLAQKVLITAAIFTNNT